MASSLKQEFDYYRQHQADLVKQYNGKYVVLKDRAVLGAYDDELSAITATEKKHPRGTFLVQKVEPGTAAYTQTFHSRVAFGLENEHS